MLYENSAPPFADGFRRTMFMVIVGMAVLGTVVGWYIVRVRGFGSPALNTMQGVNTIVLSALFVATWLRLLPQRAIEYSCLLYAVSVCAACMVLRMYLPQYGSTFQLEPMYLWFPVLYVFAFMLTNHKTGLVVSSGILALLVCTGLPYLVHHINGPSANITVQVYVVSAAMIVTLYFFSSYQERLRLSQMRVDQLAYLSNTDDLTKLSNRRGMATVIGGELARFAQGESAFALMLFDIDHFKAVNDRFGHGAGDEALVALTARAMKVFRDIDVLGRWGGDEFVALVQNVGSEEAERMANALCTGVASSIFPGGRRVTISCGVTVAMSGDNIDGLLQRADAALYAAKRAGRNRAKSVLESR